MTFSSGSLVRARGREWIVLPGSTDDVLRLRPLTGGAEEEVALVCALESAEAASFPPPDPRSVGDFRSARLLRDALRLGFRASGGPFRSFGSISVDPRSYQLVPLMMALRMDPVRLLIADDVGIGKTVEAALIAKELLVQGSADGLAVLCPPHLTGQWQAELRDKFHIDAVVVGKETVARLERGLPTSRSLFDVHRNVVVSIDYIKLGSRRHEFVRACPDLVIVDEAHGCAPGGTRARQQRFELVSELSSRDDRHMILVTPIPHSGKAEAFQALAGHLDARFKDLPDDLSGDANRATRQDLARHYVQRRRADIVTYLGEDTPFPTRHELEATYRLSGDYKALFDEVLAFAREIVRDPSGLEHRRRFRWWAALGLLRALASSPAAAAETLRKRAENQPTSKQEVDDAAMRMVMDLDSLEQSLDDADATPAADLTSIDAELRPNDAQRLKQLAQKADALRGENDPKLKSFIPKLKELLDAGYRPIVFCKYIATAEYVAEELRKRLPKNREIEVVAVTGLSPSEERERLIEGLAAHPNRVLVATDCISEGVNLQEHFDAVVHYDLSWSPTSHEQREGRVDRYGQPRAEVRTLLYYGLDNQIDGLVLQILIRKHQAIRKQTGVAVGVPKDADKVMEAIAEGLLLHENAVVGEQLAMFDNWFAGERAELDRDWEIAKERQERNRRTLFAQNTLDPEDVLRELKDVREALGDRTDVRRFVLDAIVASRGSVTGESPFRIKLGGLPRDLRERLVLLGAREDIKVRFELPVEDGEIHLVRTSPIVEELASYVLDGALDPVTQGVAARCGVIRTADVTTRTTLILSRVRFDLTLKRGAEPLLVEEWMAAAFEGEPGAAQWIDPGSVAGLFEATPSGNVPSPDSVVAPIVASLAEIVPEIERRAAVRAKELADAHQRVRKAAKAGTAAVQVDVRLPIDVLGAYVFLPVPKG